MGPAVAGHGEEQTDAGQRDAQIRAIGEPRTARRRRPRDAAWSCRRTTASASPLPLGPFRYTGRVDGGIVTRIPGVRSPGVQSPAKSRRGSAAALVSRRYPMVADPQLSGPRPGSSGSQSGTQPDEPGRHVHPDEQGAAAGVHERGDRLMMRRLPWRHACRRACSSGRWT